MKTLHAHELAELQKLRVDASMFQYQHPDRPYTPGASHRPQARPLPRYQREMIVDRLIWLDAPPHARQSSSPWAHVLWALALIAIMVVAIVATGNRIEVFR